MGEKHDSWVHSFLGVFVGAGQAVGHAAAEVGHAVGQGAQAVGHAAVVAGEAIGHAAVATEQAVVHGAEAVGHAVVSAGEALVHGVGSAGKAVGHAVADTAHHVADPEGAAKEDFAAAIARFDAAVKSLGAAGLDTSHYVARGKELRAQYAAALANKDKGKRVDGMKAAASAAKDEAGRAETDTGRTKSAAVEGVSKAITDMRNAADALIKKLPKDNAQKPEFVKQLADLDKSIAEDGKITDRAQRAKHEKASQRLAEELLDRAGDAAHDKAALQATYKKALEDRYGFKVSNTEGLNTHNDQVYKMFDMVPDGDVTQDKMTAFKYSSTMPDGKTVNPSAFYAPAQADIVFSSYGDTQTLDYKDPTSKAPEKPNAFSISTLHELGHSVDDRFGIMRSHGAKPGAGGWRAETIDSVAKAYMAAFQSGAGSKFKLADKAVLNLVTTALGGTLPAQGGLPAAAWAALKPILINCTQLNSTANPWNTPQDTGGRTYHDAGTNNWVSYLTSARNSGASVSDYQWRSPAEFFAEFYAWTYFNKKSAPNSVEAGLTAYMFGGTSSAPPAKH